MYLPHRVFPCRESEGLFGVHENCKGYWVIRSGVMPNRELIKQVTNEKGKFYKIYYKKEN
ncbi:MAG: hypothetical protein LBN18_02245 [Dysgonamonadaceae bacterium]|jgi:hypothetical protein|nr:hypothetical protein [Dysgonamonadaceae bacterium]